VENTHKKYHTIIVGAGPGGLACARILARQGIEVLVIEKKSRIGPKVCAGGITWSGLTKRLPKHLIEKSFSEQHVHSNWQGIKLSSPHPIVSTVNREKLGQWMLQQAIAAGATVKTGVAVREITERYVTVGAQQRRYGYQYLVGADGSASIVRRHLKIGTKRLGIGIQYLVPGEFDKMEWHLDANLFNNGYGWIFPHKNVTSVGVYGERDKIKAKNMLRGLHRWAARHNIDLHDLQPQAALVNFDYRGWRFGNKMLVGDAAGLASGLTGEGICPAIISGETAARAIIAPSKDGNRQDLTNLIRKQQKHQRILDICGKNKVACMIIMEMLILALRTKLLDFNILEMAD